MNLLIILGIIWVGYAVASRLYKHVKGKSVYLDQKSRLNIQKMDISKITLSPEQQKILNLLETTSSHYFITGKAGTGKSVLLQFFKENSAKKVVICAPTGVAALNVGGQTIHSLFRIPPAFIARESLKPVDAKTALLLKNIDTVVIDEISMVRADLMDAIDHRLRQARRNPLPFGGAQIVMFGDMYQLSPIVSDPELHKYFADTNGGYYFFNAHVWKKIKFNVYELTNIFRQKDETFISILNAIREGVVAEQHLVTLNARTQVPIPEEGVLTLATTNQAVNEINNYHLDKISEKMYEYKAIIIGNLEYPTFPTEEILKLKKGAQIMLLKNDKEKRWVNGSIGYIESLDEAEIKINVDGFTYSLSPETWNKIRYKYNQNAHKIEEEVISSFTQYPLRLAWAITIHKSQGHTYGSVTVDMGSGAFTYGQTYVALSRCKSLEGLYLKREIVREDIKVDHSVISFMHQAIVIDTK